MVYGERGEENEREEEPETGKKKPKAIPSSTIPAKNSQSNLPLKSAL